MPTITPNLWFEKDAEEAAEFYRSVFPDYRHIQTQKLENTPSGTAVVVTFEILGQRVTLLEAGPVFQQDEAFSFLIACDTQQEVDEYWDKLLAGGGKESVCGWLKDRYGVSWQVVPKLLDELINDPDKEKSNRVVQAMLQMVKIESDELLAAAEGKVNA